jgi:hypothetical protein
VANGKVYVATYKRLVIFGLNECMPIQDAINELDGEINSLENVIEDPGISEAGKAAARKQLFTLSRQERNDEVKLASCEQQHHLKPKAATAVAAGADLKTVSPFSTTSPPGTPDASGMVTGLLIEMKGTLLTLQTSAGTSIRVDASEALSSGLVGILIVGKRFIVQGSFDPSGILRAHSIARAKEPFMGR